MIWLPIFVILVVLLSKRHKYMYEVSARRALYEFSAEI